MTMTTRRGPAPPTGQGATGDVIALTALFGAATLGCGALAESLDGLARAVTALLIGASVVLGAVSLLGVLACFLDARRGKAPISSIVAAAFLSICGVGLALSFVDYRWPGPGGLGRDEAWALIASVGPVVYLAASVASRVFVHRVTYLDPVAEAEAAAADTTPRSAKIARAGAAAAVFGGLYVALVMAAITSGVTPPMPSGVAQIAFGTSLGFARFTSGEVAFWGRTRRVRRFPAARGATHLDVRGAFGCLVTAASDVACWIDAVDGKDRLEPVLEAVSGTSGAASVAVASKSACALLRSGSVVCWGLSNNNAAPTSVGVGPAAAPASGAITDAVELVAGVDHVCARRKGGGVVCWGEGSAGQLGSGLKEEEREPDAKGSGDNPAGVVGVNDAAGLAAGARHTCALRSGGEVLCWGANEYGQLGDGTTGASSSPVRVVGLSDAQQIAGGDWHTCARRRDGSVVCWGSNGMGQLGTATLESLQRPHAKFNGENVLAPAQAALAGKADVIFASSFETCAELASGELDCWGANGSYLLRVGLRMQCGAPGFFSMPMCSPRPSKVTLDE